MEELRTCIEKIKQRNPLERLTVDSYIRLIQRDCSHIAQEMIIEACRIYSEKDLYDKPVVYLKAIMLNLHRDMLKKREREFSKMGSVPQIKL